MKQNPGNSGNGANRLLSQLTAEKKKTVMAFCLIGVMLFMWVRVLGKKMPQSAVAAVRLEQPNPDTSGANSESKISFIELPSVKGRNDVLTRNFFASGGWRNFMRDGEVESLSGTKEVSVILGDGSEEVAKRVAEKLKLEAIVLGENPQAFINDKLLSVGDTLLIRDGVNTYECEVVGIEEKMVIIRCEEAEITLKFAQAMLDGEMVGR